MGKNLQFVDSYHEKNYVEIVQNFMGKLNKDLYIVLKLLSINEVYTVAKEYIVGTNIMFKELLSDSRIENTSKNNYSIYQYNKDDESLLFVFLPQSLIGHRGVTVKLRGLENYSKYLIKINDEEIIKSGSYLMNRGLDIRLSGDYSSEIIKVNRI